MRKLFTVLAAATFVLGIAAASSATSIDFRDSVWSSADGEEFDSHTYTSGDISGLTVSLQAGPEGSVIYQDSTDGVAVQNDDDPETACCAGWEYDEIEWDEVLKISFSSEIMLNSITFSDLFDEFNRDDPESGRYSFDEGSSWVLFDALDGLECCSDTTRLTLDVGMSTDSLWFAGNDTSWDTDSQWGEYEYSVRSLDVTPVPEPGTLLLLGSGLLVFGLYGRLRKA